MKNVIKRICIVLIFSLVGSLSYTVNTSSTNNSKALEIYQTKKTDNQLSKAIEIITNEAKKTAPKEEKKTLVNIENKEVMPEYKNITPENKNIKNKNINGSNIEKYSVTAGTTTINNKSNFTINNVATTTVATTADINITATSTTTATNTIATSTAIIATSTAIIATNTTITEDKEEIAEREYKESLLNILTRKDNDKVDENNYIRHRNIIRDMLSTNFIKKLIDAKYVIVYVSDEVDLNTYIYNKKGNFFDFQIAGICYYDEPEIYVQASYDNRVTLHEIGHAFDYLNDRLSDKQEFLEIYKSKEPLNMYKTDAYAMKNVREYFAESFAKYFISFMQGFLLPNTENYFARLDKQGEL